MQCKRCGKELPIGHKNTCPFCGTRLDTYITPRAREAKPRKKNNRATMMSFASIGFVILLVAIIVPIMSNIRKGNTQTDIDDIYARLMEMRADLEMEYMSIPGDWMDDPDWTWEIDVFVGKINKFKDEHPSETEEIEKMEGYLEALLAPPSRDEQEKRNDWLISHAKADIIDIPSLVIAEPDSAGDVKVTITLKNCSDDTISRVRLHLGAVDASGKPAYDTKRKDQNGNPTNQGYIQINDFLLPGKEEPFLFTGVWNSPDIAGATIEWLEVFFTNGNEYTFTPEVNAVLWK